MDRRIVNLDELDYEPWDKYFPPNAKPPLERFGAEVSKISGLIGALKLGYNVTVLKAGKKAYPRHAHRVNEELFLVLEGAGEVRIGDQTLAIRQGDLIAAPPGGPETAHQLINTSPDMDLKVLCISTLEYPDIIEYPDAGNVAFGGLFKGPDGKPAPLRKLFKADDTKAGYWDGA